MSRFLPIVMFLIFCHGKLLAQCGHTEIGSTIAGPVDTNGTLAVVADVEQDQTWLYKLTGEEVLELDPGPFISTTYGDSVAFDANRVVVTDVLIKIAHLFDSSGRYLGEIVPDNVSSIANFGKAIDMAAGIIVASGTSGVSEQDVIVFDAETGKQIIRFQHNSNLSIRHLATDGNFVALRTDFGGQPVVTYDTSGNFQAELVPDTFMASFGISRISMDNGLVAVSADSFDSSSGAVYLFSAASGKQIARIDNPNSGWSEFGRDLDLDGDKLVIQTIDNSVGNNNDEILVVYDIKRAVFTTVIESTTGNSTFGPGVMLSNNTVAAISSENIFYSICAQTILGDINQDCVVDLLDIVPFVSLLEAGGFQLEADVNQDGVVNLLDVDPFVELLSAG